MFNSFIYFQNCISFFKMSKILNVGLKKKAVTKKKSNEILKKRREKTKIINKKKTQKYLIKLLKK